MLDSYGPSRIGLVFLDEEFRPSGEVQILNVLGEDARLVNVDERLYIVCDGGFRMVVAELNFDGDQFFVEKSEILTEFPQKSPFKREKNWVPFDYQGNLLLSYTIVPHQILAPDLDGSGRCQEVETTSTDHLWRWGEIRGGTPALRCGEEYLSFFHSSIDIATEHSEGQVMPHYFMGAYMFQKDPPFALTRMSEEPIIGKNFYSGENYDPYWHPVRVVFPCGYVFNEEYIWVVYGRQDHEIWIAKLDKLTLIQKLKAL